MLGANAESGSNANQTLGFGVFAAQSRNGRARTSTTSSFSMTSQIRKNHHQNARALTAPKGTASQTAPTHDNLEKLGFTKRQSEVLHWVIQGKRDSEISVILSAKQRTVEKHVQNILRKLGVETRTGAAFTIFQKLADPRIIARSQTDLFQKEMRKR